MEEEEATQKDSAQVVEKKKRKNKQENCKVTWLLTYSSDGQSITPKLLKEHTPLMVDECYTATDRVNKYTLIHLSRKVRRTGIEKAMLALASESDIKLSEVYGYDHIISDSATEPNAVRANALYRWLVDTLKKRNPSFEYWVSPQKQTKGLLSDYMESPADAIDYMTWSKRKLARSMFAANNLQKKHEQQLTALNEEVFQLRHQNSVLQKELHSR